MNKILITFFTFFFCLTSSVGWSVTLDDLVKRDGLYYKKYTNIPFNGEITGKEFQGLIKSGKGTLTFVNKYPNGGKYIGEFKNNQFNGNGILTYQNDDQYKGECFSKILII